jgi:hypothetical protein
MSLEVLKVKDVKKKTHPLDAKLHEALPRHPYLQLLCSPPRGGKTNLLMNILFNENYYKAHEYWSTVYYISPTQLFDQTCKHYLPKMENIVQISQVEDIINLETILQHIIDGQKKLHKKGDDMERILIVLDDAVSYLKPISVLATKYRHHSISFSVVSQNFRSIPLIVRNCANSVIVFHLNNMKEVEKINDEYGENHCADFVPLLLKHTEKKYSFIHIDNERMKISSGFDNIICDSEAAD